MPLYTDIPQLDEQFRRTLYTQVETSVMPTNKQNIAKRACSYTVTRTDFNQDFRRDYVLVSAGGPLGVIDLQFSLIALSRAMFKNSQPLEGEALNILNTAYSQFFSKTPTRL